MSEKIDEIESFEDKVKKLSLIHISEPTRRPG